MSCNLDGIKQNHPSRKSVKLAISSRQIAYGSILFRLMHHSELYETTPTATTSQLTRNMRFRSHQEDDSILNVRGGLRCPWRRIRATNPANTNGANRGRSTVRPIPVQAAARLLKRLRNQPSTRGIGVKRNGLAPKNSGASPLQQIYCEPFDTLGKRHRRPASAALGSCPAFREGKGTKHLPLRARKATAAQTSCFAS